MKADILDIRDLNFAYQSREILREISLSLKQGEFLGFLGPNGSGKSTFLKNLLGFLKPSGGRILYAGTNTVPSGKERSRLFSFVPQNTGLRSSFAVQDVILMGRLPHLKDRWAGYSAKDREKAREVMKVLGLESMADRNAMSLSGGELQKVIIARCLVQEGDIILLDEATSGLDLNHSIEIMELMRKKTAEESKTVVAALHDLNLASQYCDRIVLLKEGRIRYQGSPREILTSEVLEDVYGIQAMVGLDVYGRPFVLPRRASGTHTGVS
ncbi:MAG: ABC transporter ATP-binding protein [Treponema sp.]|jgi:iron complex transport system ATP-binding protein|nr:ABC transporter ATP-binding protein [Treponema sp.]